MLSVLQSDNFAHYCARTYYEHRNYASLTHKHAVNCLLEASWVVTADAQRVDATRSTMDNSSSVMMSGIDEDGTNDSLTARKKSGEEVRGVSRFNASSF